MSSERFHRLIMIVGLYAIIVNEYVNILRSMLAYVITCFINVGVFHVPIHSNKNNHVLSHY